MRIHIIGASGAGTSTLATALAQTFPITLLDSDDYYWVPTLEPFSQKRDPSDRFEMLRADLEKAEHSVLAGSIVGWGPLLEDSFDLIVFLTLDAKIRVERLRQRELARFGRVDEEFLEWAGLYDVGPPEGRSLAKHREWLNARTCPILELDGDLTVAERVAAVVRGAPPGVQEVFAHPPAPPEARAHDGNSVLLPQNSVK